MKLDGASSSVHAARRLHCMNVMMLVLYVFCVCDILGVGANARFGEYMKRKIIYTVFSIHNI